jgi:hypothetical protein
MKETFRAVQDKRAKEDRAKKMAERRELAKKGKQEQAAPINSLLQELSTREGFSNLRVSREVRKSMEEDVAPIPATKLLETSKSIRDQLSRSKEAKSNKY